MKEVMQKTVKLNEIFQFNWYFFLTQYHFRDRESEACLDMAKLDGYIISTGGVLLKERKPRNIKTSRDCFLY